MLIANPVCDNEEVRPSRSELACSALAFLSDSTERRGEEEAMEDDRAGDLDRDLRQRVPPACGERDRLDGERERPRGGLYMPQVLLNTWFGRVPSSSRVQFFGRK